MRISEFQKLIKDIYYHRDKERGVYKSFIWLVEEIGELARNLKMKELEIPHISEELADIIAWTVSIANILNINLEKSLKNKYPDKCYVCNSKPCQCNKEFKG